jgi:peptide/nickel transport system substrate-binding protein
VYVFRLRDGVRFHDGSRFEAADVVASIERARAPQSLIGGNLANVAEVRIEGPHAVALRTRVPTALLLQGLTAVPITKVAAVSGLPVGTGPYQVAEFAPGSRVTLRRFAGYYGEPPELARVAFQGFRGEDEALAALKTGQPVVVLDPPRAAVALARTDPRHRVAADLSGSLVYLAFDLARSPTPGVGLPANPFRDLRVRRAIRLALDLDGLIAGGASSGARAATQLAPPGVFGFDPGLAVPARDLTGAKALLLQAGLRAGFRAVLDVRQHDKPLADAVAAQLGDLGIRVSVNPLPSEEFIRHIDGGSSLYTYSWVLGQETGEALKNFFHSKDPERGLGLNNRTGYSSPEVDRAIEDAMGTLEREARLTTLYRVMRLLMDDLPWIPLHVAEATRIYPRDLVFPPRIDGMLVLREARRPGRR